MADVLLMQWRRSRFLRIKLVQSTSRRYVSLNRACMLSTLAESSKLEESEEKQSNATPKRLIRPLKNYLKLGKAQLSALIVGSALGGQFMSGNFDLLTSTGLILGTGLSSFSAGALNQIYEIHSDKQMLRTQNRPLPSGEISVKHAKLFALSCGLLGPAVLYNLCSLESALLGLFNIFLYSAVYTPLKQKSELNTWVGAVVGAIPPLMGYAATGSLLDPEAWLLSSVLFLWQFPHFFALAYLNRKDYRRGGHQMVCVNDPGGHRTSNYIMTFSILLSAIPFLSVLANVSSIMFPLESILFNGYLLTLAKRFDEDRSRTNARRVFLTSLWYLPLLMALMVVHRKENSQKNQTVEKLKRLGKELCVHEILLADTKAKLNEEKPFCLSTGDKKE